MQLQRSLAFLAAVLTFGAVGATSTAQASSIPRDPAKVAFVNTLSATQRAQFNGLSAAQQNEAVALFADPKVAAGSLTAAEVATKYPGASVSSTTTTTKDAVAQRSSAATAAVAAVTYSVHSNYRHTVSFLFFSNTANLDYYYYTNGSVVTGDQRCTWTDSGISVNDVNNLTIDHWTSGGYGYCYATIQVSASFWVSGPFYGNGYVYQDMKVNGRSGVIWTYFYEQAP